MQAELTRAVEKGSRHQQDAAEQSPPREANQVALLEQAVKLREAKRREENHDDQKDVIRDQFVGRKHRRQDDRPQEDRGGEPSQKSLRLRRLRLRSRRL